MPCPSKAERLFYAVDHTSFNTGSQSSGPRQRCQSASVAISHDESANRVLGMSLSIIRAIYKAADTGVVSIARVAIVPGWSSTER